MVTTTSWRVSWYALITTGGLICSGYFLKIFERRDFSPPVFSQIFPSSF